MEKQTVQEIKKAVRDGRLPEEFAPKQVNAVLGIDWAGVFLPKHRLGNPGSQTEHFARIRRGLYCLR
jgi:hypothetical protein